MRGYYSTRLRTIMAAHPSAPPRSRPSRTASGRRVGSTLPPALAGQHPALSRLPVSIRLVLESVLRNFGDGQQDHRGEQQDFTGVPLLADLAAMRATSPPDGPEPQDHQPLVPDLVVDHSVMVDHFGKRRWT